MKKFLIFSLLGAVIGVLTSCFGVDKYRGLDWCLYVVCEDTIKVEYPVPDINYEKDHDIVPTSDNVIKEIVLTHDTVIMGQNYLSPAYDYSGINIRLARKTYHHDSRILFIDIDALGEAEGALYEHPDGDFNYRTLDSLVNIYGVTFPAQQNSMIVPIIGVHYD